MGKDKSNKTVMGKDANGTFHPGKGKPSGINKQEGLGILPTDPDKMDQYIEISEKYTEGEDTLAEHVPVRHKNRNTSKGEDTYKAKENKPESNKSDRETFTEERTNVEIEELPGILNREQFTELANFKDGITISLYFPTNAAGEAVNEQFDLISFKSTLNTVEQNLLARGYDQGSIQNLLKPAHDLVRDDTFWRNLDQGLGIFIGENYFKFIKMPVAPEQQIIIESTFYVTPLIPLLTNNDYFFLLVISKHQVKLFKADAFGMQHIPVELPQSIQDVKRLPDLDATTFRRSESGRRANPAAMSGQSHGAGGGNPDGKDNMATYFEAVDDILWEKVFNKENAPLVLAGVEYEIPIYRSVCDYHNVWEKALTGSREHQETKSLYKDARELMEPYFMQRTTKALEQFGNRSATELTSSIVADVIPAAYYGRIAQLFVCTGEQVWGTFDEMTGELVLHDAQQQDSEHLLDNAVVKTLSTGGDVFVLSKDQMPVESCLAAILRY